MKPKKLEMPRARILWLTLTFYLCLWPTFQSPVVKVLKLPSKLSKLKLLKYSLLISGQTSPPVTS